MRQQTLLFRFLFIMIIALVLVLVSYQSGNYVNPNETVSTSQRAMLHIPVNQEEPVQTTDRSDESKPVVSESLEWNLPLEQDNVDLLAINDAIEAYYTLLINSFTCGEFAEAVDFLDLSEIQMQNVVQYLSNKMLYFAVEKEHGVEDSYTWHKPLIRIDRHVMTGTEAEVDINLRLTNLIEGDILPDFVYPGENRFKLRKIEGQWKLCDIDPMDDNLALQYLRRDKLIDVWTKERIETMLQDLSLENQNVFD